MFTIPLPEPNSPNHLLSAERAEELLEPYIDRLNHCIQSGWDAWKLHYAHRIHVISPRARAAIVFDEIKFAAMMEFAGNPNVVLTFKKNAFLVHIGDKIILRFKKLDKRGRCSNIATRQQMMFQAQTQLFPRGTLLSAGYSLDDLQLDISQKLIVCQLQNRVIWSLKIGSGGDAINVVPMPPAPTPPLAPAPETKVELREEPAKADEAEKKAKAKEQGKE